MWPLVQSLPELVHHAPTVVDMLLALLEDPKAATQVTKTRRSLGMRCLIPVSVIMMCGAHDPSLPFLGA